MAGDDGNVGDNPWGKEDQHLAIGQFLATRVAAHIGHYVAATLAQRKISQVALAERVGGSESLVSMVIHGTRKIPLEAIGTWAVGLELAGEERERFRLLAALAHTPGEVVEAFFRVGGHLLPTTDGEAGMAKKSDRRGSPIGVGS